MFNSPLCLAILGSVLSLSGVALAEEAEAAAAPAATPPPRFRFGLGGGLTFGLATGQHAGNTVSALGTGLALEVDLGVQFTREFALFLHNTVSSVVVSSQASSYLVVEYTPIRQLSLASGVGYDGMAFLFGNSCAPSEVSCIRNNWSGVSVPLVVGLNLFGEDGWNRSTRRVPLRLQWLLAGGIEPTTGVLGGHSTIGVGAAWM